MKKLLISAALVSAAATPAFALSSLVGDKDCFGLPGVSSCPDGIGWASDLGGTFFTSYQDPGDPAFTDKWDADVDITYQHTYVLGAASSASLTIGTAGLADNRGPWDVFFNGSNIGQFTYNTSPNAFEEVRTFNFIVPTALLTGNDTVLLAINNPVSDGYSIDYSELTINAVPEPESYVLMLAGLGFVGAMARRRAVRR